jgi:NinB protein
MAEEGKVVTFLRSKEDRMRAKKWIDEAKDGSSVELRPPRRTPDQNALMWSLLTQIAQQKKHMGKYYTVEQWKTLFMHALGQEVDFLPALDGSTFVPVGFQTSQLTKQQMHDLLEMIVSWGLQNDVKFREYEYYEDNLRRSASDESVSS